MNKKVQSRRTCWAASLGDCDGGMSREHYISGALLNGDIVHVRGFDFTPKEWKKISRKRATKKMLCKKHNSDLSPLDAEMKITLQKFKDFYGEVFSLWSEVDQTYLEFKDYTPFLGDREPVNGRLMERWMLKTTLNILQVSPEKYNNFTPDSYLVELAFGGKAFEWKTGMGLYFVDPGAYPTPNLGENRDLISIRPYLTKEGQYLFGSLITIFGMNFFLRLALETKNFEFSIGNSKINILDEKFFHLSTLAHQNNKGVFDKSIGLEFAWDRE